MSLDHCCPTFLTLLATEDNILEAVGCTSQATSIYLMLFTVLWDENRIFKTLNRLNALLELNFVCIFQMISQIFSFFTNCEHLESIGVPLEISSLLDL